MISLVQTVVQMRQSLCISFGGLDRFSINLPIVCLFVLFPHTQQGWKKQRIRLWLGSEVWGVLFWFSPRLVYLTFTFGVKEASTVVDWRLITEASGTNAVWYVCGTRFSLVLASCMASFKFCCVGTMPNVKPEFICINIYIKKVNCMISGRTLQENVSNSQLIMWSTLFRSQFSKDTIVEICVRSVSETRGPAKLFNNRWRNLLTARLLCKLWWT